MMVVEGNYVQVPEKGFCDLLNFIKETRKDYKEDALGREMSVLNHSHYLLTSMMYSHGGYIDNEQESYLQVDGEKVQEFIQMYDRSVMEYTQSMNEESVEVLDSIYQWLRTLLDFGEMVKGEDVYH